MKVKTEMRCTRKDLADYLEKLASELRSGSVEIEKEVRKVPEELDVQVHTRDKKGRMRYRLEWSWSSLTDYDTAVQKEIVRWESSFKQVKKDLAVSFKRLKQAIGQGAIPLEGIVEDFQARSQAFADLADPDWERAAREYMAHLENLQRALKVGDLDLVLHELHDLENRMVACHREFK